MRLLRLPLHIVVAALYAASIAIATAAIVAILTQRLEHGGRAGVAALLAAVAGFGFSIWRTYRPRRAKAAPVPVALLPQPQAEPEPLRAAA